MKKCNCEWCERTEENWNGRFKRIDCKWYCSKHHQQLKKHGKIIDLEEIPKIKHKNTVVYKNGVNDMPYGWTKENEWNKKVYQKWAAMLQRCYSEKYHKKQPTYKECYVCNEWLLLSNFVKDFKLIDGYDEEKFLNGELELDKDIKSNGQNKKYSLENCMLTSRLKNSKQAMKTRDNSYLIGKNNKKHRAVACYDDEMNIINIFYGGSCEAERETGISNSAITQCCKFWEMNCNKNQWFKTHKKTPCKRSGGYFWKYWDEN